ncbi:MurR/RpiR family transcriptional regulator [Rhodovarius crocodyli]|nr:MurR/RpiR family transcriptional regulator [Rhodovarius crocodyli]
MSLDRLRDATANLSPTARRVARFILDNPALALASSAAELAARIGTSDATVVRSVQALGFSGLPELKRAMAGEMAAGSPAQALRETLAEAGEEAGSAMDLALDTQREAVEALGSPEVRAALRDAVATLHPARRVLVFGIGPSAPLAHYAALLLARAGRAARALDAAGTALADQLLDLAPGDALLVMAYGQPYREVATVFAETRRLALPLVLVTDSLDRSLARQAEVVLPVQRGQAHRVALHGATLVALEALVLGLAALDGPRALGTLDHLNALRAGLAGARRDIG